MQNNKIEFLKIKNLLFKRPVKMKRQATDEEKYSQNMHPT